MRRLLLTATAAALLVGIGACYPPTPRITVPPTPTTPPIFASDEEALAAAEEAYAAYLAVSDAIFAEGGARPERLNEVASGEFLSTQIAGFEHVSAKGWHSLGVSSFDSVRLQAHRAESPTRMVTVYLCDDVSAVDVLGRDGVSVVSPDRPERTLFEVAFDFDSTRQKLLVSGQEVWSDEGC